MSTRPTDTQQRCAGCGRRFAEPPRRFRALCEDCQEKEDQPR